MKKPIFNKSQRQQMIYNPEESLATELFKKLRFLKLCRAICRSLKKPFFFNPYY